MFRRPEVLTQGEVVAAEVQLKALQRHGLELVDPKGDLKTYSHVRPFHSSLYLGRCLRLFL